MERTEENEYSLSVKAGLAFSSYSLDMGVVAEGLEKMGVGQWCSIRRCFPSLGIIYRRFPSPGMSSSNSRAESYRDRLREALGENAENYALNVEPSEEGICAFVVERVR